MKYSIGLTFSFDLNRQKIDQFRLRTDPYYSLQPDIQLSLLPSFDVEGQAHDVFHEIEEVIDSHLHGIRELDELIVTSLHFIHGKKDILFMRPQIFEELLMVREVIFHTLYEFGAKFSKPKSFIKEMPLITLARFANQFLLAEAIELGKRDFIFPLVLKTECFTLFRKKGSAWIPDRSLYNLHDPLANSQLQFYPVY